MPSHVIAFMMGCTCAGKSSFLDFARKEDRTVRPELTRAVGFVEVGKMLRAKYPPSHFQGQAAPAHTAEEAWTMCRDAVNKLLESPLNQLILVDGQPRDMNQADKCSSAWPGVAKKFVFFDCPLEERRRRSRLRHAAADDAAAELTERRLVNDMTSYQPVLTRLLRNGVRVDVVDTDRDPVAFHLPLLLSLTSL